MIPDPVTATPTGDSTPLVAVTWSHPALPGARISLIPEPLLEAEALAMGVNGFAAEGHLPVGHSRRRAVGFPAWPILHDPANARHALNLVADLQRARAVAKSKPKVAKDRIDALVAILDGSAPHFVPTFCEEAGRILIAADSPTLARALFGRAREAERAHALPIDRDHHRAVFEEFGYAGALTAREITAEIRLLRDAEVPDTEIYTFVADLQLSRIRAGTVPTTAMIKELVSLGKRAGISKDEVTDALLTEIIDSAAMASAELWPELVPDLQRLVTDPVFARRLLLTRPRYLNLGEWLELMERVGALAYAESEPRLLAHLLRWDADWARSAPELVPVIERIAPAAAGTTRSLSRAAIRHQNPDVLEALLAAGVEVTPADPTDIRALNVAAWLEVGTRDLARLAAHPQLAPLLRLGVRQQLRTDPAKLLDTAPLRPLVLEWLTEQADAVCVPVVSLMTVRVALENVEPLRTLTDAGVTAQLDRIDEVAAHPDRVLAQTLNLGLPPEYTWPAYEQAFAAAEESTDSAPSRHLSWPDVVLTTDDRAWWIREFTGDAEVDRSWLPGRLGPAGTAAGELLLTSWNQGTAGAAWSGRQQVEPYPGNSWSRIHRVTLEVPGGRLQSNGIQRPGEPALALQSEAILSDGHRFWVIDDRADERGPVELDPATGARGRRSVPEWFAALIERRAADGWAFSWYDAQLMPATEDTAESPLGVDDGLHRLAVFHRRNATGTWEYLVVGADGTEYRAATESRPEAVLPRPGGGAWLFCRDEWIDVGTGQTLQPLFGSDAITALPRAALHRLRLRSPAASQRLREAGSQDVAPLLAVATPITAAVQRGEDPDEEAVTELVKIAATWLGLSAEDPLAACVAVVAVTVASALGTGVAAEPDELPDEPADVAPHLAEHPRVLRGLVRDPVSPTLLRDARLRLAGSDVATGFHWRNHQWLTLIGRETALLGYARTLADVAEIEAVREAWRLIRLLRGTRVAYARGDHGLSERLPGILTRTIQAWTGTERPTIDGEPELGVLLEPVGPAEPDLEPAFDRLVAARRAGTKPLVADRDEIRALAELAGVPYSDAATVLLQPNLTEGLTKAQRQAAGVSTAEALRARDRIRPQYWLATGLVAAGTPAGLVTGDDPGARFDLAGLAAYWRDRVPESVVPDELAELLPTGVAQSVLTAAFDDTLDGRVIWAALEAVVWLADALPYDSPNRSGLAGVIERLHRQYHAGSWPLGFLWSLEQLRIPTDATGRTDLGGWSWTDQRHGSGTVRPAELSDRARGVLRDYLAQRDSDDDVAVALHLTDTADRQPLLDWAAALRTPLSGDPHDPRVSAPAVVAEIVEQRTPSKAAATYWLQLLALAEPTDANVRRWNGWKKKDLDAAAAELVAAELVVVGKRSRAGRSHFLPGGWHEADATMKPLEAWKVAAWGLTPPPHRSRIRAQHRLYLPDAPPAKLFTDAWARVLAGDEPGYADLETEGRR